MLAALWAGLGGAGATERWADALAAMPWTRTAGSLERDNALPALLAAFQSNATVKAMVLLPGLADDFLLLSRGQPALGLRPPNLLAAVSGLTNTTALRVTFRAPLLLLHVERDRLEPAVAIPARWRPEWEHARRWPRAELVDRNWERLQPELARVWGLTVRPEPASPDTWHFARHYLSGWDLTGAEALAALSLAGRTRVTVERRRVVFAGRE